MSAEPLPSTAEGRVAEYQRLEEEMVRMAQKGHWTAVEHHLNQLEKTGQAHTQEVLVVFAQVASRQGDLADAKSYLERALQVTEHEELQAWLERIEEVYGPVLLAADLPANYRLTPASLPFQLEERSAVEFARRQVFDDSYFDGLLPKGIYSFHPLGQDEGTGVVDFEVRGGQRSIDLRTKDEPSARDRRKRAKLDKKLSKP